jgi:hypothetical protein
MGDPVVMLQLHLEEHFSSRLVEALGELPELVDAVPIELFGGLLENRQGLEGSHLYVVMGTKDRDANANILVDGGTERGTCNTATKVAPATLGDFNRAIATEGADWAS